MIMITIAVAAFLTPIMQVGRSPGPVMLEWRIFELLQNFNDGNLALSACFWDHGCSICLIHFTVLGRLVSLCCPVTGAVFLRDHLSCRLVCMWVDILIVPLCRVLLCILLVTN